MGAQGGAEQPQHPALRARYNAELVSFSDLMFAASIREQVSLPQRPAAEQDYQLLLAKFVGGHAGTQVAIHTGAAIGACLHPGDGGNLELTAVRNTIRFRWQDARAVQKELNELDDDAQRWLRPKERQSIRLHIYSLITQVHTTVVVENFRHKEGKTDDRPTTRLEPELTALRSEVALTRVRLAEEAERAAQVRYALGMGIGTLALALLIVIAGGCLLWQRIPAVYIIGAVAGGLGACLSVLQRLTRGKLRLDYRTEPAMLLWFGTVRPVVGAVVGMIAFCIVKAGLISDVVVVPTESGMLTAFIAFIAFLAAFSERFFQDMLRVARPGGLGDADASGGYEPTTD